MKEFSGVSYFTLDRGVVRNSGACKRPSRFAQAPQRRRTMFTKTLFAALILATASVALTSKVNAGPNVQSQAEYSWMERASKTTDGGGI
jgi:hypothetical protein